MYIFASIAALEPVYPFTSADRNLQVVAPTCAGFARFFVSFSISWTPPT